MYISFILLVASLILIYQGVTYLGLIATPHIWILPDFSFILAVTHMVVNKWGIVLGVIILTISIFGFIQQTEELTREFRFKIMWFSICLSIFILL